MGANAKHVRPKVYGDLTREQAETWLKGAQVTLVEYEAMEQRQKNGTAGAGDILNIMQLQNRLQEARQEVQLANDAVSRAIYLEGLAGKSSEKSNAQKAEQ